MEFSMIAAIKDAGEGFIAPAVTQFSRTETDRTKAASAALEKALGLDEKSYKPEKLGLLEQVLELEAAREELGFQNGFRVAVRLMAECLR